MVTVTVTQAATALGSDDHHVIVPFTVGSRVTGIISDSDHRDKFVARARGLPMDGPGPAAQPPGTAAGRHRAVPVTRRDSGVTRRRRHWPRARRGTVTRVRPAPAAWRHGRRLRPAGIIVFAAALTVLELP